MSNTIIPIFIPGHHREKAPDPKCPHCKKKLPGWEEPSGITNKEFALGFSGLMLAIALLLAGIFGGMEGSFGYSPKNTCGEWFSKRWHYVVPTYQVGCRVVQWLRNKSDDNGE